jgi:hypothetical protein
MGLTVKEMEVLCIFYEESLCATLEALKKAEGAHDEIPPRAEDVKSLISKLSSMEKGERIYLDIEG